MPDRPSSERPRPRSKRGQAFDEFTDLVFATTAILTTVVGLYWLAEHFAPAP